MNLINTNDRYKFFLFLITFVIFQIFIIFSKYYSIYIHVLSLLVFILNVYPLYKFSLNFNVKNEIPLYEFAHLYFFFCYTLAVLFPEVINYVINRIDTIGMKYWNLFKANNILK